MCSSTGSVKAFQKELLLHSAQILVVRRYDSSSFQNASTLRIPASYLVRDRRATRGKEKGSNFRAEGV